MQEYYQRIEFIIALNRAIYYWILIAYLLKFGHACKGISLSGKAGLDVC
ncbi:hypothetical protein SAMN05216406_11318 [Nitrosomonas ureae]|uniref:Uncharacterized protein n=1 Tax=Nitrosomonas ureae TaxID=44577 RepID=A0A1H2EIZ1_9PROT|nr:hypothetical protein SAMN05216406_11318 [Nitrosomonas ureae]